MDLVEFSNVRFNAICNDYQALRKHLAFKSVTPTPLSVLKGDNIIERFGRMDWYQGPTLLRFLETVDIRERLNQHSFWFPVQWVNRPNADFRGFSGTVVAGSIRPGDKIRALPLGQIALIDRIVLSTNDLDQAVPNRQLPWRWIVKLIFLEETWSSPQMHPVKSQINLTQKLVWMDNEPGYVGRRYILQLGTSQANASLSDIKFKYDVNTFQHLSGRELSFNEIANVQITLDAEIPFEAYADCPGLGAFVLINRFSNATVTAGMIRFALRRSSNVHRQAHLVDRAAREKLSGHRAREWHG